MDKTVENISSQEDEKIKTSETTTDKKVVEIISPPPKHPVENMILMKPICSKVTDMTDSKFLDLEKDNLCYILAKIKHRDYKKSGLYEGFIIEWVRRTLCSKTKIFLDIGANCGTYTVSLASHCSEVYSFEPQRSTYYALCGSVYLSGLSNVECIRCGLGSDEQSGPNKLCIKTSDDGNGSHSSLFTDKFTIREEDIEIRTLDSFNFKDVGFIKMDVEANELNVLKGAKKTIIENNYPHILFESNFKHQSITITKLLAEYGYKHVYKTHDPYLFLASNT